MINKLKPCPWCNGTVSLTYNSMENAFAIWHDGDTCKFKEPFWISADEVKSIKEAYEAWNSRKRG